MERGIDRLAATRVSLEGWPQRVRRRAGDEAVMQMRVGWSLVTADRVTFTESAAFTPYELPAFDHGRKALAISPSI